MLDTGVRILRLLTAAVTLEPLSALPIHEQLATVWTVPADKAPLIRAALVLSADHEFNASTFACRVIAGTGSDMYSAIAGGIGALRGPKHGGANEVAFEIQKRYGDANEAEVDIRRRVEAKLYPRRRFQAACAQIACHRSRSLRVRLRQKERLVCSRNRSLRAQPRMQTRAKTSLRSRRVSRKTMRRVGWP